MPPDNRRPAVAFSLALLAACGGPSPASPQPATPERPPGPPRVVVAVVLDQLPTHALDAYWPLLDEDGALHRTACDGAFHHRVVFGYAGTYTAAGHAAIHTGAPPATTGVVSNQVWDRVRQADLPIVDDGDHTVHGVDAEFASPAVLRVETVADVLRRETGGRGIVASLSIKDRGAIFAGGRRPDLVLWYDHAIPGFTTSAYYADAPPPWLADFQRRRPLDRMLETWTVGREDVLEQHLGPDDAPGEGDWEAFGTTFPHDPQASESPWSVVRATPASSEYLLALAEEAVAQLGIGTDDVPDLLAISISSTDYAGHVFGPHSWEYADNLIRTDRALGAFLARLAEDRGPIAVLITSDHGGAPLPERIDGPSGRLLPETVVTDLEAALDEALGAGDWVSAYVQPFVYLSEAAREPANRDRAVAAAIEHLSARPEIALAADAREAIGWREHDDEVRRLVAWSIPDDTTGDVFVVPREGYVIDEDMPAGHGTSHGTPWAYDRTVPVLFAGPGVEPTETRQPVAQDRVGATISALLGVPAPAAAPPEPLPGALR